MASNSTSPIPPFYGYDPSSAAAVIFTVLFILSFVLHVYQCFATKTWHMTPLLIGGFLEASGYLDRLSAHSEYPKFDIGPYIIESLFLLLAPTMTVASLFLVMDQLLRVVGKKTNCQGGNFRLTDTLTVANVLSFGIQAGGSNLFSLFQRFLC